MKELIIGITKDMASFLLYYDRKECEDLEMDAIQDAVEKGIITKQDIVDAFEKGLEEWW